MDANAWRGSDPAFFIGYTYIGECLMNQDGETIHKRRPAGKAGGNTRRGVCRGLKCYNIGIAIGQEEHYAFTGLWNKKKACGT